MVGILCVDGGVVTLAANWSNGVCVLLLPLLVYMCPLTVSLESGGHMRSLCVVSVGKVVIKLALIVFLRVVMGEEEGCMVELYALCHG